MWRNYKRREQMNYKVKELEHYWEICAEKPIQIEDCCYDETRDEYVIAVKHYKGQNSLIEYIIFNKEHKIVKGLKENKGVNPKFVIAPDKSVWVSLSSTHTKREGEIVLPLYERERVTKEIIRSDLGTDFRFWWNGFYWGYVHAWWSEKEPDKLLQYQFDKKSLYKTRKAVKLEDYHYAVPYVQDDIFYLSQKKYEDNDCTIHISKMTETLEKEAIGKPVMLGEMSQCFLTAVSEEYCKLLGFNQNEIYSMTINMEGQLLEKKKIHSIDDSEFYSIMNFNVQNDGTIAFSYVCENQCGSMEIKDCEVKEIFQQQNGELYCHGEQIEQIDKMSFNILSDGKMAYHMAANIDARKGKSKSIYITKTGG